MEGGGGETKSQRNDKRFEFVLSCCRRQWNMSILHFHMSRKLNRVSLQTTLSRKELSQRRASSIQIPRHRLPYSLSNCPAIKLSFLSSSHHLANSPATVQNILHGRSALAFISSLGCIIEVSLGCTNPTLDWSLSMTAHARKQSKGHKQTVTLIDPFCPGKPTKKTNKKMDFRPRPRLFSGHALSCRMRSDS